MEYYSAIKWMKSVTTCIDLESIMLHEISQTEKDKYCIISFKCGIWKAK